MTVRQRAYIKPSAPIFACLLLASSCSPTSPTSGETDLGKTPEILHLVSGKAHYIVDGGLVSQVQPQTGNLLGIGFVNGRLYPRASDRMSPCGTTSNITGNGSPWVVSFAKPSGWRGDHQVVAVGVDSMETAVPIALVSNGHSVMDSRRTVWQPRLTPMPKTNDVVQCEEFPAHKIQWKWSGGTMLCDPDARTNVSLKILSHQCYIELPIDGTTWMTEFYLREGDEPDDQVSYARRFVQSISAPDDISVPTTFSPLDPSHPDGSIERLHTELARDLAKARELHRRYEEKESQRRRDEEIENQRRNEKAQEISPSH